MLHYLILLFFLHVLLSTPNPLISEAPVFRKSFDTVCSFLTEVKNFFHHFCHWIFCYIWWIGALRVQSLLAHWRIGSDVRVRGEVQRSGILNCESSKWGDSWWIRWNPFVPSRTPSIVMDKYLLLELRVCFRNRLFPNINDLCFKLFTDCYENINTYPLIYGVLSIDPLPFIERSFIKWVSLDLPKLRRILFHLFICR